MDINTINSKINNTQSYKNRNISSNNKFEKRFEGIVSNSPKRDKYTPMPQNNNALLCEVYSKISASDIVKEKQGWSRPLSAKEYNAIYNRLVNGNPKEIEDEDFWNEILDKDTDKDKEQESETDSSIIVNADGSRVLLLTIKIGSTETTMSIEISKPTNIQNNIADSQSSENSCVNSDTNI